MSSVPGTAVPVPEDQADRPKTQLSGPRSKAGPARFRAAEAIRGRRAERHQEQNQAAAATTRRTDAVRGRWLAEGLIPELTDAQRETAHTDFRTRLRAVKAAGGAQRAYRSRRATAPGAGPETALSSRQNPTESVDAETADPNSPRRLGTTENSVSAAGQEGGSWAAELTTDQDAGARYEQRNCKITKRMRLLDEARAFTSLSSLRKCGAMPLGGAAAITLKSSGDGGFTGLARCGSVWGCPECAPVVRAERAANLEKMAAAWMGAGHGLAMATLTTRHWEHARLAPQLDGIANAWRKLVGGSWWAGRHVIRGGRPAPWGPAWEGRPEYMRTPEGTVWKKGFRQRHDIVGVTRALEMTHSWNNSWHAHIHAVLWFETPVDTAIAREVENELFDRWRHLLTRAGLGKPVQPYGVRVDPAHGEVQAGEIAKYLVKVQDKDSLDEDEENQEADVDEHSDVPPALRRRKKPVARALGNELLRGDLKVGRKEPGRPSGRSTFEILRRAAAGEEAERELWLEYEQATKGHRMLTWGGDIKNRLAALVDVDDRDDTQIVEDEDRKAVAVLAGVEAQPWRRTVAAVPGRRGRIRGAVKMTHTAALKTGQDPEEACREAVIALLEEWGLVRGVDILGPVAVVERQEQARTRWQTVDELDAGTHILGVRPRDAVRPETAKRRANGRPIARELPSRHSDGI